MPKKNERVHLLITLSLFVKVGVFAFKLNIEFVLLAHYLFTACRPNRNNIESNNPVLLFFVTYHVFRLYWF